MFTKSNAVSGAFTLIELQVAAVVLLILWLMIAGIEYFLIQNTMPFIVKEDPDPKLASVFEHMERNIPKGIYWRRYVNPAVSEERMVDIDIFVPDEADYRNRSQDKKIRYRFDTQDHDDDGVFDDGVISFYPDVTTVSEDERWTWTGPCEILSNNTKGAYISPMDMNSREVYVELENPASRSTELMHKTSGIKLSRTFRMRALW